MSDDAENQRERIASTRIGGPTNASAPIKARFETVRPRFEGSPPRSTELSNWQCFEGMVLALIFSDGTRHTVLGSAVIVAPCVAVGALHTVRDKLQQVRDGTLSLAALGISSHGAQVWRIRHIVCIENTDLVILTVTFESEFPPHNTFYQATITTRLPEVGEQLVFGGFRASSEEFLLEMPGVIDIQGSMRLGSGTVRQIFLQGRDRLLVPWPSLEVDAPLFGGMSGGPVFDSRGGLIGLGSRSMEMGTGDEPSPMIVALLWPALAHEFPYPCEPPLTATLLDMHGIFTLIERPEAVTAQPMGDSLTTRYTPWS
jgi:hypothetical protein